MSPLLPVAVPSRLSRFDVGVDPKKVVFAAEKIFQSLILEILNMATNLVELRSTGRRELGP